MSITLESVKAEQEKLAQMIADLEEAAKKPEFCCEYSWLAAKEAAWRNRNIQCLCDHPEYCDQCYPLDFREGGEWCEYDPEKPKSKALCIGDPTNPRDDFDTAEDSVEAKLVKRDSENNEIQWKTTIEAAKILEALKLADDCIGDIQEYNVPQRILSNIDAAIQISQERLK